jgi:nucleoid DNA-binding protein
LTQAEDLRQRRLKGPQNISPQLSQNALISGFGKFYIKEKGKCGGRNPGTGEALMLAERWIVTFKFSMVVKRKPNGWEG